MNAPLPAHLMPRLAPRAVPAEMIEALKARFGERCSTALVVREQHGRDESPIDAPPPEAVVFCESTEDVAAVVKLADRHAVPVIPFGVGSSLEGHLLAVQGGVSIDLSRMNKVVAVNADDLTVTVQAGMTRTQVNDEIRHTGLFFPIDPGADASIGGMAATRASGTNAVRYGTMRENVLGAHRRHGPGRRHPHRHARAQVVGRLRPDAPVRRQRRHARRDDRDHAEGLSRCPRRCRPRPAPSRRSTRRCARRSRSSRWASRSPAASCSTGTRCGRSTATTS